MWPHTFVEGTITLQPQKVLREDKGGHGLERPYLALPSGLSVILRLVRAEGQVPGCPPLPLVTVEEGFGRMQG